MSFPDAELERLEKDIKVALYINIGDDEYGDPNEFDFQALITRMKAAEFVVISRENGASAMSLDLLTAKWRMTKGEK